MAMSATPRPKDRIDDIENWSGFEKYCGSIGNPELKGRLPPQNPPSTPPVSLDEARLDRKLALVIKDWPSIPEWQHHWLSCCLSSKCDHLFGLLTKYGIDREDDVIQILSESQLLWNSMEPGGRSYYIDQTLYFLLRRFSYGKAWKMVQKHKGDSGWLSNFFNFTHIIFIPRLLGALILGAFFFSLSYLTWELPSRLPVLHSKLPIIALIIMLMLSYLYLLYDCRRRIELKDSVKELVLRTFPILAIGLLESFLINGALIVFFKDALKLEKPIILYQVMNVPFLNFPATLLTFTIGALFIGIFTYLFWGEKSIAEPL